MTTVVLNGVTALSHLGVIRAEGPDAASFLHGQLTQDFSLLGASDARLAALCTAKGRVIASFIGIKPQPELILLVCSRDILAATLKRLSMYVLRAKAKLSDATEQYALYGLAGTALTATGSTRRPRPASARLSATKPAPCRSTRPTACLARSGSRRPGMPRPRARLWTTTCGNGARCAAAS